MPELSEFTLCDFFGCQEPVCRDDLSFIPPTLRFCQEHRDECAALIESWDASSLPMYNGDVHARIE